MKESLAGWGMIFKEEQDFQLTDHIRFHEWTKMSSSSPTTLEKM